jgi:superfamily II DNA/RNA helicase
MLRALMSGQRALFCVPYRALADEVAQSMRKVWSPLNFRIKSLIGGKHARMNLADVDVAVCTIESASAIINRILLDRPDRRDAVLGSVGCLVVDEAHVIQQGQRGAVLELLITKLLVLRSRDARTRNLLGGGSMTAASSLPLPSGLQIVAMSATLPGIETMARWLNATLFDGDSTERPQPITELLLRQGKAYTPWLRPLSPAIAPLGHTSISDTDCWQALSYKAYDKGISTLVFCSTKMSCQNCSDTLSRSLGGVVPTRDHLDLENRINTLGGGCSAELAAVARHGVAFHHGDLGNDLRRVIEQAFREGLVRVLFATSTLANGVNLPAQWVLFRTPVIGQRLLSVMEYVQMSGRAGRGVATTASSITEPRVAASSSWLDAPALSVTILDTNQRHCYVGDRIKQGRFDALVELAGKIDSTLPLEVFLKALQRSAAASLPPETSARAKAEPASPARAKAEPASPARAKAEPASPARAKAEPASPARAKAEPASPARADTTLEVLSAVIRNHAHHLDELRSAMNDTGEDMPHGMRRLILEAVACELANGPHGIGAFLRKTLFWAQHQSKAVRAAASTAETAAAASETGKLEPSAEAMVGEALMWLIRHRLLEPCDQLLAKPYVRYTEPADATVFVRATVLGAAAAASAMAPEEAVLVVKELRQARVAGISLQCDGIHPLYLLAPFFRTISPSWAAFGAWWLRVSTAAAPERPESARKTEAKRMLQIATDVGISPEYISSPARASHCSPEKRHQDMVHRRFWSALILHGAATTSDTSLVLQAFHITAGTLDRLREDSSTFCSMVLTLCGRLGWGGTRAVLGAYEQHLASASRLDEAHALTVLPAVTVAKAKALIAGGFRDPGLVARGDVRDIAGALRAAVPFVREGDSEANTKRLWEREAIQLKRAAEEHRQRVSVPTAASGQTPKQPASAASTPMHRR